MVARSMASEKKTDKEQKKNKVGHGSSQESEQFWDRRAEEGEERGGMPFILLSVRPVGLCDARLKRHTYGSFSS